MTWIDTLRMAVHNLWQRRGRAALSLLGIVVGCVVLLMADAGSRGVASAIQMLFDTSDFARQIRVVADHHAGIKVPDDVLVVEGDMADERRKRIRKTLRGEWLSHNEKPNFRRLTAMRLSDIEAVPHVEDVVPGAELSGVISLNGNSRNVVLNGISRSGNVAGRLVAGTMFSDDSTTDILVDDVLAWRLGYINDDDLRNMVGQTITLKMAHSRADAMDLSFLEFTGLDIPSDVSGQGEVTGAVAALVKDLDSTSLTDGQKQLIRSFAQLLSGVAARPRETPDSPREKTFRICGVYRTETSSDFMDIFRRNGGGSDGLLVAPQTALSLLQESRPDRTFRSAVVTVTDHAHLADVVEHLKADGYRCFSALRILEKIDSSISRLRRILFFLAGIILFTTCLGICNTLFVSILERTPEFGVMKSMGARDSHIRRLMLCEGAMLGAIGGAISLPVSIILGWVGDSLLRQYAESRLNDTLSDGLFDFTWMTVTGVIVISIFLCVLASLMPAIRASRLDPVVAMRRT